jgi:hypothetical protein
MERRNNNKNEQLKQIKVKPPNISDETMQEMYKFFLKTSIPRILAEEKNKNGG